MPRPEWEIEVTDAGLFDVWNYGRIVSYDRDSVEEAMAEMKRRGAERGDQFTLIETDGYRTKHRVR